MVLTKWTAFLGSLFSFNKSILFENMFGSVENRSVRVL